MIWVTSLSYPFGPAETPSEVRYIWNGEWKKKKDEGYHYSLIQLQWLLVLGWENPFLLCISPGKRTNWNSRCYSLVAQTVENLPAMQETWV